MMIRRILRSKWIRSAVAIVIGCLAAPAAQSAAGSIQDAAPSGGQEIDVLPLGIGVAGGRVSGGPGEGEGWKYDGSALLSPKHVEHARVGFRAPVPREYRLTVKVAWTAGESAFLIFLPYGGAEAELVFDGWGGEQNGIQYIDGNGVADAANPTRWVGKTFTDQRERTIVCTVASNRINATIDGKPAYSTDAAPSRFRGRPPTPLFSFYTYKAAFRVTSMTVLPLGDPSKAAPPTMTNFPGIEPGDPKRPLWWRSRMPASTSLKIKLPRVAKPNPAKTVDLPNPSDKGFSPPPETSREALAALRAEVQSAKPKPLPKSSPWTWEKYRAQRREWIRRTYVDAFKANRNRDPKWDDVCAKIVDDFAAVNENQPPLDPSELLKRCEAVIALGCDDPFIYALAGDGAESLGLTAKADAYLSVSLPLLAEAGYCAAVRIRFWQKLSSIILRNGARWEHRKEAVPLVAAETVAAMTVDGSFRPEERRYMLNVLERLHSWNAKVWPPRFAAALEHTGKCDPWVLATFKGVVYRTQAWHGRGSDYVFKTTDKEFARFHEQLALAKRSLLAAMELHPDLPEPYEEMIACVMGDGPVVGETERYWFDRCVAAQMDYRDAYSAYRWALRPRWGGSHQALLAFGRECLATRRHDLGLTREYLLAVQDIARDLEKPAPAYRLPKVADELRTLMRALIAQDKNEEDLRIDRAVLACIEYHAGNREAAKAMFAVHGVDANRQTFRELRVNLDAALQELGLNALRAPTETAKPLIAKREKMVNMISAGRTIVIADDKGIGVWNGEDGASRGRLQNVGRPSAWAITKTGNTLAAGYSTGEINIWNLRQPGLPKKIGRAGRVEALAFSPTGELLAAGLHDGQRRSLGVFDVRSLEKRRQASLPGDQPLAAVGAIDHDDWCVVFGAPQDVRSDVAVERVEPGADGGVRLKLDSPLNGFLAAVFSPACAEVVLAVADPDGARTKEQGHLNSLIGVDASTGKTKWKRKHSASDPLLAMRRSTGQVVHSTTRSRAVTLDRQGEHSAAMFFSAGAGIRTLGDLDDGVVVADVEGAVWKWSANEDGRLTTKSAQPLASFAMGRPFHRVDWDASGVTLCSNLNTVLHWSASGDYKSAEGFHWQSPHFNRQSVSWSPDRKIAAFSGDEQSEQAYGIFEAFDTETGERLHRYEAKKMQVTGVAVSPDNSMIAFGLQNTTVNFLDIQSKKVVASGRGHTDLVEMMAFSADGSTLATADRTGRVLLWDVPPRAQRAGWDGKTLTSMGKIEIGSRPRGVGFSPDGNWLGVTAERLVSVISTETRQIVHQSAAPCFAFSSDSGKIALGGTTTTPYVATIVDLPSFASKREIPAGERRTILSMAFSPDGDRLLTINDGWKASIIELKAGSPKAK
jgi:WD40 repeat protein